MYRSECRCGLSSVSLCGTTGTSQLWYRHPPSIQPRFVRLGFLFVDQTRRESINRRACRLLCSVVFGPLCHSPRSGTASRNSKGAHNDRSLGSRRPRTSGIKSRHGQPMQQTKGDITRKAIRRAPRECLSNPTSWDWDTAGSKGSKKYIIYFAERKARDTKQQVVECTWDVFVQRGGRDVTFDGRYFGFGGWAAGYIPGDGRETLGW
jgi:hypothetical protein